MRKFEEVEEIVINNEGNIAFVKIYYTDGKKVKFGVDAPDLEVITESIKKQMESKQ
jgi:sRNA-binding carbon storage regulator CsrA